MRILRYIGNSLLNALVQVFSFFFDNQSPDRISLRPPFGAVVLGLCLMGIVPTIRFVDTSVVVVRDILVLMSMSDDERHDYLTDGVQENLQHKFGHRLSNPGSDEMSQLESERAEYEAAVFCQPNGENEPVCLLGSSDDVGPAEVQECFLDPYFTTKVDGEELTPLHILVTHCFSSDDKGRLGEMVEANPLLLVNAGDGSWERASANVLREWALGLELRGCESYKGKRFLSVPCALKKWAEATEAPVKTSAYGEPAFDLAPISFRPILNDSFHYGVTYPIEIESISVSCEGPDTRTISLD